MDAGGLRKRPPAPRRPRDRDHAAGDGRRPARRLSHFWTTPDVAEPPKFDVTVTEPGRSIQPLESLNLPPPGFAITRAVPPMCSVRNALRLLVVASTRSRPALISARVILTVSAA